MSTDPVAIDHTEATALLTRAFRLPRFQALLASWLRALNELDEIAAELAGPGMTDPDVALAAQLELLRQVVRAARATGDDVLQRALVKTEIAVRKSQGRGDDLLLILDVLFDDAPALTEFFPAGLQVGPIYDTSESLATAAARQLGRAKAAGVGLETLYSLQPATNTFRFSDASSPETSSLVGFGDSTSPGTGGHFAGVKRFSP